MAKYEELKPPLTMKKLDQFARAICNLHYYSGVWVTGYQGTTDDKINNLLIYTEKDKNIITEEKYEIIENLENYLKIQFKNQNLKKLEYLKNLENLENLEKEINNLYTTFDAQNNHAIRTNIYIKKKELEKKRNDELKILLTATNSDIVKEYIDLIDLVEIATRYFQRKILTGKKIEGENKDYYNLPKELDEDNTKHLLKYKKGLIEQFKKVMRDNKESTKNAEKIANDYTYEVTNLDEHGDRFASALINSNYITKKIERHNNELNNVDKDKNENRYNTIKEELDDLNTLIETAEKYLQLKFNEKSDYPKQLSDDQVEILLTDKKYSIEHFVKLIEKLNEENEKPTTLDDVKLEEPDYNTTIFNDAIEKINREKNDVDIKNAKFELLTVLQNIYDDDKSGNKEQYQQIIEQNSSLLNRLFSNYRLFNNYTDKDLQFDTGYSRKTHKKKRDIESIHKDRHTKNEIITSIYGDKDKKIKGDEHTQYKLERMRNIIKDIKETNWFNKTRKRVVGRGGRRSTRKRKKTIRKKRKNKKRTRRFR